MKRRTNNSAAKHDPPPQEPVTQDPSPRAGAAGGDPLAVTPLDTAAGFGKLARRITTWSANVLASAVILVLALTLGRQVLDWWRDAPAVVAGPESRDSADLLGLTDPDAVHSLIFGDLPYALDRSAWVGDEASALQELRDRCRAVVSGDPPTAAAVLPLGKEVLEHLTLREPVEAGPGWRIIQNGGPVITVVALRFTDPDTTDAKEVAHQKVESVLSWGIGFRTLEAATEKSGSTTRWTLYTCTGRSPVVDSDDDLSLPLPPGCHRTLAVRVHKGGSLIGFAGPGPSADIRAFWDRSLPQQGWSRTRDWLAMERNWHARFERDGGQLCQVMVTDPSEGMTSGIITISAERQAEE